MAENMELRNKRGKGSENRETESRLQSRWLQAMNSVCRINVPGVECGQRMKMARVARGESWPGKQIGARQD